MWEIQFLLFYVYHSFWNMCIRGFRMGSYVPYIIMTSLLILKQFIFLWQIQFLLFHVYHIFWCMCIGGFWMGSYVPYMIIISLLILKQCIYFSERFCQFLPIHRDFFRNLKLWPLSDKLHTAFFNVLYTESREYHKVLISWYSIFPCGIAFITHCE